MVSSPSATPPTQPSRDEAQSVRGYTRGGGWSGDCQDHYYAFPTRPEVVASDDVITCMILVCHRDASVLFDPGSTYSYVSSYFARYLDMSRDSLIVLVHVSTPVGDSIMVYRVYHSWVVTVGADETRVDLLLLNMVDFEVIFGMDWLSPIMVFLIVLLRP